jgi:hypothetical protein
MQSPILEIQDDQGHTLIKQDIYSLVHRLLSIHVVSLALHTELRMYKVFLDGIEVEPLPEVKKS